MAVITNYPSIKSYEGVTGYVSYKTKDPAVDSDSTGSVAQCLFFLSERVFV